MPLSAEQEQKVKELRQGITAAPVSVVVNNKDCLLVLFDVIDELKKDVAAKSEPRDPFKV